MKKPNKVLITVNGMQDPYSTKEGKELKGPILTLLERESEFYRLFLFYTSDEKDEMKIKAERTAQIIRDDHQIEVILCDMRLDDPTNYESILREIRRHIDKIKRHGDHCYISATSGTPQMHACWILLAASGEVQATVIHSKEPKYSGVKKITFIDPQEAYFPSIQQKHYKMEEIEDIGDINEVIKKIGIIGNDKKFREILEEAAKASNYNSPVLITGETGTGKEKLAEFIKLTSRRRDKNFESRNCGSFTSTLLQSELFGHAKGSFTGATAKKEGIFKIADNGIVFLDEIAELPAELQSSLLRVIENGEIQPVGGKVEKVNIRIIAATNKDLNERIKEKEFRSDLYHRLNVHSFNLPPLRHRKGDIIILAQHFQDKLNQEYKMNKSLSQEALISLTDYSWPGNIRDLKNTIERTFSSARNCIPVKPEDIRFSESEDEVGIIKFPDPYPGFDYKHFKKEFEHFYHTRALEIAGGNKTNAAKLLGVTSASFKKTEEEH